MGGVFNSGILATGVRNVAVARFNYAAASGHWVQQVAAIEAVCEQFEVPLRAAALQFPLAFWDTLRARGLLPQGV